MISLSDNVYNSRVGRTEKKLKVWKYAGLMLTYRCPAACEFCYYYCRPGGRGLMNTETAIGAWQSLRMLSGENAKVHITGGEPFLYFDRLVEILHEAKRQALGPVDMVETNGFWATDKSGVVDRLRLLDECGLERLKISWDPFHAPFVDARRVRLLVETAREVLGSQRVLVRWEKYLEGMPDIQSELAENWPRIAEEDQVRFTGRAAEKIAPLCAQHSLESFQNKTCRQAFLGARGVHIDPHGHVFSGQCSGIIIGNIHQTPLEQLWQTFVPNEKELICNLFNEGPLGLLDKACFAGYMPHELYAGKCHLCSDLRQFFFDKGLYPEIIGPESCYRMSGKGIEGVAVRE